MGGATTEDVVAMVSFARVVEAGSFTGAAARLQVSKSVVSARIAQLEERLGMRLLHRTTRRLSLTPDGLALYERCSRLASLADEAAVHAAGAAGDARGLLRVTAPNSFAESHLTVPIAAYLARHPDVRVELVLSDKTVDLVEEGIDVAVRISAQLRDSSLVVRKLGQDRLVVAASPAYLERRGEPQTPGELVHHECLRYSLLKATDEWRFRDPPTRGGGPASYAVPVEGRLLAGNGAVLRQAILNGMGLAVTPWFLVDADVAAGRLRTVLDAYMDVPLGLYAVYAPARSVPTRVRSFVDTLAAHFRTPRWQERAPRPTPAAPPTRTRRGRASQA
jgi:DNA-binding transcriptional LysR family regulator